MIIDNDIFWNNFNFHEGKPPFKVRGTARGARAGRYRRLLLGGRGNRIENNRITELPGGSATRAPGGDDARSGAQRRAQHQWANGTDTNGGLMYDGNGRTSSARRRELDVRPTAPRRGLRWRQRVQPVRAGRDARVHGKNALNGWAKPRTRKPGYKPLEVSVRVVVTPSAGTALISAVRRRAPPRRPSTSATTTRAAGGEGEAQHDRDVALAGLRPGGRRPRHQAVSGQEGEEVPIEAASTDYTLAQADRGGPYSSVHAAHEMRMIRVEEVARRLVDSPTSRTSRAARAGSPRAAAAARAAGSGRS